MDSSGDDTINSCISLAESVDDMLVALEHANILQPSHCEVKDCSTKNCLVLKQCNMYLNCLINPGTVSLSPNNFNSKQSVTSSDTDSLIESSKEV